MIDIVINVLIGLSLLFGIPFLVVVWACGLAKIALWLAEDTQ